MSILIKGMEMPKTPLLVCIYPNGICSDEEGETYRAVPVPPYGDLIERDALREEVKNTPRHRMLGCLVLYGQPPLSLKQMGVTLNKPIS